MDHTFVHKRFFNSVTHLIKWARPIYKWCNSLSPPRGPLSCLPGRLSALNPAAHLLGLPRWWWSFFFFFRVVLLTSNHIYKESGIIWNQRIDAVFRLKTFHFWLHFAMFQPSIHIFMECNFDFPSLLADFLLIHFPFALGKVPFCLDIFNSWEVE